MGVVGCAQVCFGMCGCVWVAVFKCMWVQMGVHQCVWNEFSEYLLEKRVLTSADFNTYSIRILSQTFKSTFTYYSTYFKMNYFFTPQIKSNSMN